MGNRIEIGGPYFEDFVVGEYLPDPPSVTMTAGHAAIHQALFADRLRLPLDAELCRSVTGSEQLLINPSLFCNAAIGQTTYASQRVKANLFYRGLILKNPVYVGDTLTTRTKPVALKQNKPKPGRAATGMVALEMQVINQRGEEVLKFWRCPMIPCRDPEADTGHNDSFDAMPNELDMGAVADAVPNWDFSAFRQQVSGAHSADVQVGDTYVPSSRDTISLAPELVRLTLNMAVAHVDAQASTYGKRLVYGGHTISMAAAQIVRGLPNLMTLLAWHRCDHIGPVFEDDILRTEVTIKAKQPLDSGGCLVDLHAQVFATRGSQAPEQGDDIPVLDWEVVGLMA